MEFEWDESKAIANDRKHRVSFFEAVESFEDPHGIALRDEKHSHHETRRYWIGRCRSGRVLTTWFTERKGVIRIIGSAELRKFRRIYECTQNQKS